MGNKWIKFISSITKEVLLQQIGTVRRKWKKIAVGKQVFTGRAVAQTCYK